MIALRLCRTACVRLLGIVAIISSLLAVPAFCQESEDSQIFIDGFNSYQQKDYPATIDRMNDVLRRYPDTPLKDVTLFWLSRAYYETGNQREAASHYARFCREFPEHPLKNSVNSELPLLASRYEKGDLLPSALVPLSAPTPQQERTAPAALPPSDAPSPVRVAAAGTVNIIGDDGDKGVYREKAIRQYRSVMETYPGTPAARSAEVKLQELGAAPLPPPADGAADTSRELSLEVAPFAAVDFTLAPRSGAAVAGRPVAVPFELVNRGNGRDSFRLESAFPADYSARFAAAAAPGTPLDQTPDLAQGDVFKGVITLTLPTGSADGQLISHPVKAVSRLFADTSQARELRLTASAPVLRAVTRTDTLRPLPGDRVVYRTALLNAGSAPVEDGTLRIAYPPQLEPLDNSPAGFRQDGPSSLILSAIALPSGGSRDISVSFRVRDDAPAGIELISRGELTSGEFRATAPFTATSVVVAARRQVSARLLQERVTVIPGQRLTIPVTVSNNGNSRETFSVSATVIGGGEAVLFNDVNRDGIRQTDEPILTHIGPLAPREETTVALEIRTAKTAADAGTGAVQLRFMSQDDAAVTAVASVQMSYARPVLALALAGRDSRPKPGDVVSYDLTVTNSGSHLARSVELKSTWPDTLEMISAEPSAASAGSGTVVWRYSELGAGEKRVIRIAFRVKSGTSAGTAIKMRTALTYQDHLGNSY